MPSLSCICGSSFDRARGRDIVDDLDNVGR